MIRIYSYLMLVALIVLAQPAMAADSPALEAAKAAAAEPVATPEPAKAPEPAAAPEAAKAPDAAPAPAAEPAAPAAPVVASPPTVKPTILEQLKDHTPIPIRSSLDQANDTNGNRTLEYDEIKEYIKNIRASLSKGGRYPTNTDILYHFDKNHDGYMDGGEVGALESHIH